MSHNLNSMFYTGEKPWHGLGTKLENAATSKEAIKAAGLGWAVQKDPVFIHSGKSFISVEGSFAVVRQDTMAPLGIVGPVYTPLQNRDAFSFFDAVVGEKAAMYHTAGALGAGEKVWILAKLPGYIKVTKEDVTEKFLLLTNSHDGSGAVQILFTPIRVVCQNTLNIALSNRNGTNTARLRHTMTLGQRVEDVRDQLGIMNAQFALFEELSQKLASKAMTYTGFKSFVKQSGLIPAVKAGDKTSTRAENILEEVSHLFERGKGNDLPGVRGTAWAGFNAITEYVDYKRSTRGEGDQRTKSLLFGSGAHIKQKAWDAAVTLI